MRPGVLFNAFLDGVTFHGTEPSFDPGVYVTEVDGLLDGGDVNHESLSSGAGDGDGEFDTPNRRTEGRVIVFSGYILGSSMWDLGKRITQLRGLLAGDELKPLSWVEFGEEYHAWVRRGSGWRVARRGDTMYADFTVRFRAPSQRILGAEKTVPPGTSILLVNRGNFPACPTFTVTGVMPSGYSLVGGGKSYVVSQGLASGQTHSVDMYDAILLRNGVAQPGGASSPRPLLVPPSGALTVNLVPVSGAGTVSAVFRPTFV